MIRLLGIAKKQFLDLAFGEFLGLAFRSMFRNEENLVYTLDPSKVECRPIRVMGSTKIKKADIADLENIEQDFKPIPWEFQVHRFDGVKDFFVAVENREIQHISWIYYQDDLNRFVRLGPKDAEIKYCLTLPEHRGKGLYPAVLEAMVGYLKKRGFQRVFITVQEGNISSIRGVEKAGFKRVGRVRLLKIMGIQVSVKYRPMGA